MEDIKAQETRHHPLLSRKEEAVSKRFVTLVFLLMLLAISADDILDPKYYLQQWFCKAVRCRRYPAGGNVLKHRAGYL